MSRVGPTAGEWKYARGTIRASRPDGLGRDIGDVTYGSTSGPCGSFRVDREESDVNGRLFAASKDLLAACERAYEFMSELCSDGDIAGELRAAIAKAKGET